MRARHEGGFSLIELMVAMVVTLIVTGAIYGLLSGGQSSFRREPELSDRQQNIRVAMDMIMRDIASAGAGMPKFMQTFTTNLDGASLTTCRNNAGATVVCPVAPSGAKTDELELMGNPNDYAPEKACDYPGGSASHVRLAAGTTQVQPNMIVMILMVDGTWTMRNINNGITLPNSGDGDCDPGHDHADVKFQAGGDPTNYNLPAGLCAGTWNGASCDTAPGNACLSAAGPNYCKVQSILLGEIVRYRIRLGADGVPNLERFSSSTTANFSGATPQFQVIARGIEDMQVRYTAADGTVTDNTAVVDQVGLNYNTLTQSVSVTLSARSEVQNVAGMRSATAGPTALRGSLTSVGSPRSVLNTLGTPLAIRSPGWVGPSPWN